MICILSVLFFTIGLFLGELFTKMTGVETIYGAPLPVIVALIFMASIKFKVDIDDFKDL